MRLTKPCPICTRPLVIANQTLLSDTEYLTEYKCGHSFVSPIVDYKRDLDFRSANLAFTARPYQEEGIEFIIKSNFNCIVGDQMRLGKTPQALLALRNAYAERTPCLILVKSANLYQWQREYKVWTDTLPLGIWTIEGTKNYIPPGFSAYLISMDTFSRPGYCTNCQCSASFHPSPLAGCRGKKGKCGCIHLIEKDSMVEKLLAFGFKLVIVDEAHSFKNTDSNRSQALVGFLHNIAKKEIKETVKMVCFSCKHEWEADIIINLTKEMKRASKTVYCPSCNAYNAHTMSLEHIDRAKDCGVVMLSGTSIKNRADELFIPLNIVAPEVVPSQENFRRRWLSHDGKRIIPHKMEEFKKAISSYFLRREKEDVYTDLPPINHMWTVITIDDPKFKEAYNKALDRLAERAISGGMTSFQTIGELSVLRQICGVAKVDWTSDYLRDTIVNNGSDKYAVGIHHHAVRDLLAYHLQDLGVVTLSGEDSAEHKDRIMREFATDSNKVLVVNMLAGGVGMDFHYCHNVTVLERQWNSADEDQFEFRFYNPDRSIYGDNHLDVEYIIAKGTVDEWFYNMIEDKRKIFGETIGTQFNLESDNKSLKELLDETLSRRLV